MDKQLIDDLARQARRYAERKGFGHLADDFAQEVAIAAWRHGPIARIDRLFVDLLRREYGRTGARGTPGGFAKSAGRLRALSIGAPAHWSDESGPTIGDMLAAPGGNPDPGGRDWRSLLALRPDEAELYHLILEAEVPQREVAEALGVTESRISQRVRKVKKEVEKAVVLAEKWDDYKDDPEASKLLVSWIRL